MASKKFNVPSYVRYSMWNVTHNITKGTKRLRLYRQNPRTKKYYKVWDQMMVVKGSTEGH